MAPLVSRVLSDLRPPRPAPVGTAISHVIPPVALSKFEFRSLELQCFQMLLKLHPIELRAIFAECCPCRPREPRPGRACGIKFSLLGLVVARAVQSSPCWRQMPQNRPFSVCWESFVPVRPARAANRESFVPGGPSNQVRRAGFAKPPESLRITSLLPTGIGRRDVTSPT